MFHKTIAIRSPLLGAAMLAFTLLMSVGTLTGCATNPVTGKREISLVSSDQELAMGREGHQAVLAEYGVYNDARLSAYVDSIGQALAKRSHMPNLEWHFTVIDDPTVNAFAIPGGYIYITRGIMAHLNSEAQIAGVIGHEIGHVTARHSARQVTQQQLAGLGLGLASVFSQTFQRYSGAAQQALGLMLLKYGRDDENQADGLGIDYATAAGWDPREIPATYHTLSRISARSGQRLPTFLSTHPDPGDREARTTTLAAQAAQGKTGLQIRSRGYLAKLENNVYGNDPRQGYFEGDRFYHPEMDFEMSFPAGWLKQNARSAVLAQQPQERAVMQLTLANTEGQAPAAYVQGLVSAGKIAGAQGASEQVGSYASWMGRLTIQNQDGTQGSMFAAFIQRSRDQTFQILARTTAVGDADESAVRAAARSLRPLADRARLKPTPDRVSIVTAAQTAPFETAITKFGPLAIDVEEESILNNVEPGESVARGQALKIVRPGAKK